MPSTCDQMRPKSGSSPSGERASSSRAIAVAASWTWRVWRERAERVREARGAGPFARDGSRDELRHGGLGHSPGDLHDEAGVVGRRIAAHVHQVQHEAGREVGYRGRHVVEDGVEPVGFLASEEARDALQGAQEADRALARGVVAGLPFGAFEELREADGVAGNLAQEAERLLVEVDRVGLEAVDDDRLPGSVCARHPLLDEVRVVEFGDLDADAAGGGQRPRQAPARPDVVRVAAEQPQQRPPGRGFDIALDGDLAHEVGVQERGEFRDGGVRPRRGPAAPEQVVGEDEDGKGALLGGAGGGAFQTQHRLADGRVLGRVEGDRPRRALAGARKRRQSDGGIRRERGRLDLGHRT